MRSEIDQFKLFSYVNRDTKRKITADVIFVLLMFLEHQLQNPQKSERM